MSTSDTEISLMIVLDPAHDPGDPLRSCSDGDPDAPIWALYEVESYDDGESKCRCHGTGLTYDNCFKRAMDLRLTGSWIC